MTNILKSPAEYAELMVGMFYGDRDAAALEFMAAIRDDKLARMPTNWLADTFRAIIGARLAAPADASPSMQHWANVNAVLTAAGVGEAAFGEIRHYREEPVMTAAFRIWEGRNEGGAL